MKVAVADAIHITPHIAKHCLDKNVTSVLPYKRPMTNEGFYKNRNMSMMNTLMLIFVHKTR